MKQQATSRTGVLIVEMAQRRKAITALEGIVLLGKHGHAVDMKQVYSLLNGSEKWFTKVGVRLFRLTRAGHLRAMKAQGILPMPSCVQKHCPICGDPYIDETDGACQQACGGSVCKRAFTQAQHDSAISDAALRRLEVGVPVMA